MPVLSYRRSGLVLRRGETTGLERQVRDLQRDLRRLGYLRSGIDGKFGAMTERAIKALQHDLLHNDGSGSDGAAPIRLFDYNRGRVFDVDGVCEHGLANCLADLLDEPLYPKLPRAEDPRAENERLAARMAELTSDRVPVPFVMAILKQESRLRHFHEPRGDDEDTFIVVGLDTNAGSPHVITSRGYGAGQYTLFHHPPTAAEVDEVMLDVGRNLGRAMDELEGKFLHFVNGDSSGTRADDRRIEIGDGPLRRCKFESTDPRFLRDCARCALEAGSRDIVEGVTRFHAGTDRRYEKTQYYRKASYEGVPRREAIGCDWPYAARRYNGAGINSYHYQTRILQNLKRLPVLDLAE
jgi:hypothetical protein